MSFDGPFAQGKEIAAKAAKKLEDDSQAFLEREAIKKAEYMLIKRHVFPPGTHYFNVMTKIIGKFLKKYDVYETLEDGELIRVKDIRDKVVRRHLNSSTPYIKISFGDDHYIICRYGYDIHSVVNKINEYVDGEDGQWFIHHAHASFDSNGGHYWEMNDVDTTFMENDFEYTEETIHQSEYNTPNFDNPFFRVNRKGFGEWFRQWIELKFHEMNNREQMTNLEIN